MSERIGGLSRGGQDVFAALLTALAYLVHSNLLISTAATSVAVTTIVLVGRSPDPVPLFIVFSATFFVYSVNRATDIEEDELNVPERAAFTRSYGKICLAAGVVLYTLAVGVAIVRGLPKAGFLVLPVAAAVLYSLARLKRVLLVKNLLVGIAWGTIPLGVGVYYDTLLTVEVLALASFFTIMLTVAAAIFDIKDIHGDRAAGIRTVPIAFGIRATQVAAAATTIAVTVGVLVAVFWGVLPGKFLVLLGFLGYVLAYIPFATPERGPLFYGFIVDGEHVFLMVLVLLVEAL
ncbi:MAG: 4-hydroxybenzoate polyprenyltransferase [Natronomonas sp.]